MEDNSDANRETDVSSTTVDVPDTGEAMGLNGNVEMIIVVEKVEVDSDNEDTENKPTTVGEKENQVHTGSKEASKKDKSPLKTKESPQKKTSPEKLTMSPRKVLTSPKIAISPSKIIEINQSQTILIKDLESSDNTVDSSHKALSSRGENDEHIDKESDSSEHATSSGVEVFETKPKQTPEKPVPKTIHISLSGKAVPETTKKVTPIKYLSKSISYLQSNINQNQSLVKSVPEKSQPLKKLVPEKNQSSKIPVPESTQPSENPVPETTQPSEQPVSETTQPSGKPLPETTQPSEKRVPEINQPSEKPVPEINQPSEKPVPEINQPSEKPVPETTQPSEKLVLETARTESSEQIEKVDTQNTEVSCKTPVDNHCNKSNDSQLETASDISEKEQNKSISRELKSLIKSAKESKIISECNQLTSKTRKSRTCLDTSNSSVNTSIESEKISSIRRNSNISSKSNCSEKSEKATKRSMRSQNPEFVNKVKQFLNSVTGKGPRESDDEHDQELKKENQNEVSPKKKKMGEVQQIKLTGEKKLRVDPYCWRCNWPVEQAGNDKGHPPMECTVCPRCYHYKCLSSTERSKIDMERSWVCPECLGILHAESSDTRSVSMKKISLGMLCELLQHALARMMDLNGVEPFMQPVDRSAFPDYDKYVVHPMDLSLMKQNIANGLYGSTEAFTADAQWILHNSIIFNTLQAKLTGGARALVRLCRAEMSEIEACPECYAAAHARKPTWFTDVCSTPHILLWAKLKGFPYWPAKGMSSNNAGLVDVRFFGAHDRAWVPAKDCFLYSEKDPNNFRTKRQDILDSMQEAEQHIRNISRKYGKFVYPPFKTPFEPNKLAEQLKIMIPTFEGELKMHLKEKVSISSPKIKEKRRSNSKSSKSSLNDGETSENEEAQITSRKMADGAEIAKEELQKNTDKSMEIDNDKVKDSSRKRRRSELEEAVITIIDSSSTETQKKLTDNESSTPKRSKVIGGTNTKAKDGANEVTNSKEKTEENLKDKMAVEDNAKKASKEIVQDSEVLPSSTSDKPAKEISPITSTPIANSTPKRNSSKEKSEKQTPKQRPSRVEKSSSSDKEKQEDRQKQRKISRNRSLNNSTAGKEKNGEKILQSNTNNATIKDANKDANTGKIKDKNNKRAEIQKDKNVPAKPDAPKSTKDRLQFDDDISLAVIAREVSKSSNGTSMPTITSVRSLSVNRQETSTDNTNLKTIEVTVEANSNASIFIPTSTDNVRNMKEAANKLQKIKEGSDPPVGRVGVRAFARMKSPEPPPKPTNMEIEIKTEPMDVDADRQTEKMDLMEACNLRPVNPPANRLREVRINKVVVSPLTRKSAPKPPEIRVKAKKTFPQSRKPDEGRSELNCKNSMVYIPIQPASTQAPTRPARPVTVNGTSAQARQAPVTSVASSTINTITSPLVSSVVSSNVSVTNKASTTTVFATTNSSNMAQLPTIQSLGSIPSISQVPTNVHTVPLLTSLNGQWTFSLQPMMSVGGVDNPSNSTIVNGKADRSNAGSTLVAVPTPANVGSILPQINSGAANNRTENVGAEMPRLQQRPLLNPFDSSVPVTILPTPSSAGPLTAKFNQNAVKLTDFFRTLLEDSLEKINEPAAHITSLKMQLEQMQWRHKQETEELKYNYELSLMEMRTSFDKEKARVVSEARRAAQTELEAAVKATKTKQWCANCSQEAQFYCCWNTSYCDYGCQRAHWPHHAALCTQPRTQENNGNSKDIHTRLQPAPDLPKNTTVPSLTAGGKVATRVFTSEQLHQKTSLIVSVTEDGNGNHTMKCVGSYKQPSAQNMSPLILNKQIMNSEEAGAKKVTTSGGYLIVGSGAAVPAQRRAPALQYVHT